MDREKWITYAFKESMDISKNKLGSIKLFDRVFSDMMKWYDTKGDTNVDLFRS